MFYPGETDRHTFDLPFAASDISSVLVSYKQKGRVLVEKSTTEAEAIETMVARVYVDLSQADTLKFEDNEDISIQVNVTGSNGGRLTSTPIVVRCGQQYHRQVI